MKAFLHVLLVIPRFGFATVTQYMYKETCYVVKLINIAMQYDKCSEFHDTIELSKLRIIKATAREVILVCP
jgi:hypothetical protein